MEKFGLVLEGGGMRGIFTAGVLDCFLDYGIEFDEVIGVSAGAIHACSYASKQKYRARDIVLDFINDKRYCSVQSLLTTGDLFGVEFAYHEIPDVYYPFDHQTYNDNPTKVIAVVTNVMTGEAEYHHLSDLNQQIDNLRASASLPYVSRLVQLDEYKYLDGGIADSVPLKRIEVDGCTKNIIVLTQPADYRKSPNKIAWLSKILYRQYPKVYDLLKRRHLIYNEEIAYINGQVTKGNTMVIQPKSDLNVGRIEKDVDKLSLVYDLGYQIAQERMDEIKEFLKK